ncbi:MAG: isopeptide-forming domain-containing fimbrial protein [Clostridiales bacterium]|nr:isopeptide-forming domain-containing fimbrial protein [Clostridiales bacterium]
MKKITKLLSLLLALTMVLSMSFSTLTAYADDTYSITITDAASGHTYEAYQIFAGDLSGSTLSNITWGTGVKTDTEVEGVKLLAAVQAITLADSSQPFKDCTTAAEIAAVLGSSTYNSADSELAQAFAEVVNKYLADTATATSGSYNSTDSNYTISLSSPGYYFVKDSDGSLSSATGEAYTRFILLVVGTALATPKSSVPTVEKKVYEEDYTSSVSYYGTGYNDAADYDIGDAVKFELIGTMPSTLADYDTYSYTFHDTQSAGLTFDSSSVEVYVDNSGTKTQVSTSGYTVSTDTSSSDNCTFEVIFTNVKSLTDTSGNTITVDKDSKIFVYYSSTLNSNAEIGLPGNENEVYLEYSNNPNGSGTGTTKEDKVIVFTYELDVTKVDGANTDTKLSGAEFILYKTVSGTTYYAQIDTTSTPTPTYKVTGWSTERTEATTLTSDANGLVKVIGLDDGTYKLEETKAPDGYNLLADPVTLVISSTFSQEQSYAGTPADELTALSITVNNGSPVSSTTLTGGIVSANVENNAGAVLPSTGGMGTKIFYTLGGILVIGAGVLLIVKRRMRNA